MFTDLQGNLIILGYWNRLATFGLNYEVNNQSHVMQIGHWRRTTA
jgi:hypothetical protein